MTSQGLSYWLQWQVPVCGSIILSSFLISLYTIKNVKSQAVYLQDLWRPQWKNLNPLWLLCYRIFALICLSITLYETVVLFGAFSFYFYTQWTFALVILYFAIATGMSAYGCWISTMKTIVEEEEIVEPLKNDKGEIGTTNSITHRRKEIKGGIKLQNQYGEDTLRLRAGFWGHLMQIVYQTCAGSSVLTDLVFWCILFPFESDPHFKLDMLMSCMHSINVLFLLVDTTLNSMPFPMFRVAYFSIWSSIYVTFHWVLHACGFTWWPYPFLQLEVSWAPYWYFALAVIHIPCFGLYVLIDKAKNSVCSKWFPLAFVRSY